MELERLQRFGRPACISLLGMNGCLLRKLEPEIVFQFSYPRSAQAIQRVKRVESVRLCMNEHVYPTRFVPLNFDNVRSSFVEENKHAFDTQVMRWPCSVIKSSQRLMLTTTTTMFTTVPPVTRWEVRSGSGSVPTAPPIRLESKCTQPIDIVVSWQWAPVPETDQSLRDVASAQRCGFLR